MNTTEPKTILTNLTELEHKVLLQILTIAAQQQNQRILTLGAFNPREANAHLPDGPEKEETMKAIDERNVEYMNTLKDGHTVIESLIQKLK